MELQLIKCRNALHREDREYSLVPYKGESLLELRDVNYPKEAEIVVSINGRVVPYDELSLTYAKANDCILFVPKLEGGGGGGFLSTLAFVALAVTIAIAAPYVIPAASWIAPITIGSAAYWGIKAAFIVGSMLLGGMLINALLPPPVAELPSLNSAGDYNRSNYYGWNPVTTQQQGQVIPKFYGQVKLTGNIISAYTEVESTFTDSTQVSTLTPTFNGFGEGFMYTASSVLFGKLFKQMTTSTTIAVEESKNIVNVLIALGIGRYKEIETVKINDQDYYNFDKIVIETRLGLLDQSVISNFNDTKTEYTMAVTVRNGSPYTYRTIGDNFDGLEIEITYPNGLYYTNDQGGLDPNGVNYTIRAVGVTLGNYYDISGGAGGPSNHPIKRLHSIRNVVKDRYDITVTRTTGNRDGVRYGDAMQLTAVKEVAYDDFTYPAIPLVSIKALATDQLSGSLRFSCVAKTSYIRNYRADEVLGTDGKNYRCKTAHAAQTSDRPITGASWATYWEQKGRSAVLNDTAWEAAHDYSATKSWRVEYNNNYAWVCYDILTQPIIKDDLTIERYDGYDPTKIVTADFETWADFCDVLVDDGNSGLENRFSFNGGFDSEGSLWSAAIKVAQEARAVLLWKGYQIAVVVDQAASAVQLFSSGNIIQDSFEETFLPLDERAGEIEVSFVNASRDYERDTFFHFRSSLDRPSNKVSAQLIGCTSPAQAWRYADYALAGNEYWLRTIKFDVDIDALACTVGDVISFQHDVPQWGLAGGRVVSATSTSVTLDQSVTLEEGVTYGIMIRLTDDTLVTRTVTNAAGAHTTLTVSTPYSSVPSQYDPFAFGVLGTETKPFRLSSVSRSGDTTLSLEAIEYNANVYACDTGTPVTGTINYSSLQRVEVVTGLSLLSLAYFDNSGNTKAKINVYFVPPAGNTAYAKAKIYYRKWYADKTINYTYAGETLSDRFEIDNLDLVTYYEVMVQSVGFDGMTTNVLVNPSDIVLTPDSITYESVFDYRIAGLQIFGQANDNAFVGKDCKFVWQPVTSVVQASVGAGEEAAGAGSHIPPVWFKDYEVKIYDSTTGNLRRTEYVLNNEYTYTFEKNYEDTGTASRSFEIRVKARDRFYRVSAIASILAVTNDAPDAMTGVTVAGGTGYYIVEFTPSADPDIMGYKVYASQTTGFTPSSTNLVNEGSDTRIVISPDKAGVWYVKVAAYDSFGDISLNYSEQYSVTVSKWVEYNDLELELMKMSFQGVSWAQFAVFDDFADETKRYSPEPSTYQCIIYKNSLLPGGTVAERAYGFWSKQYTNVTTVDSGTATSVGENFLTDTAQAWFTDECKNLTLVDSESSEFTVTSNTSDTLTISGTPAAGDYSLRDDNPAYMVCYCTYEDATYGGGTGYVKMEVSFDGGGHFTTVLDTLNSIDLLEGTQAIAYPGVNYIVRFTLTNDSNGDGPVVYKYLVCTDPSPWRF